MAVQIRDVMGVMDTVEKLASAEAQTSREELRAATQTAYRDQGVSVPDHLLEQALDIHEGKAVSNALSCPTINLSKEVDDSDEGFEDDNQESGSIGFSLLELILVLGIIVAVVSVGFLVFSSAQAARRAQMDVQHLVSMTVQSPDENDHQAIADKSRNEWLRADAAEGESFRVVANAQNPAWSDIQMGGVPVKTCELLAADPNFRVVLEGASSHAASMSPSECGSHPTGQLLLQRIK